MIEELISHVVDHWVLVTLVLTVAYFARNYFNKGLNKYPGPFLASITDLWRFREATTFRPDIAQRALHEKHGDVVRLGPNALSFANPEAIKTIYGLGKPFQKSEFYPVQQAMVKGKPLPSLFTAIDTSYHAMLRRTVNSAFSMSSLVQYEPRVEETLSLFLQRTEDYFETPGKVCSFSLWLQFFAFDVIGQITYSKMHGFVDKNEDIDGMISWICNFLNYAAIIGQMPWLDNFINKNPIWLWMDKFGLRDSTSAAARFARQNVAARMAEMNLEKAQGMDSPSKERGDLLAMFLKAQKDRPDFFDDNRVLTMATSMTLAGSETTALSLSSVFYNVLKTPHVYEKLMSELDTATKDGTIAPHPEGIVSWSDSQKLPYLDACIKEAFRVHPGAGLTLERRVPPSGAEIAGEFIAGGTIVGCNAWVLHKRRDVFGDDVDVYRPERWILGADASDADREKVKMMNATMFQFGAGSRTCIGKHISLLEMYKLIPTFLRRFEINFAKPDQEWKLHNAWFVRQTDFDVTFKRRVE